MNLKPRLSGENSIITALAVAVFVVGVYNYSLGPIADMHASPANDPNMLASIKKAGVKALVIVGAVALLAQDPNIVILGGAAIIGEELTCRHAIMASPDTGMITVTPNSYVPAGGGGPAQQAPAAAPGSGIVEALAG